MNFVHRRSSRSRSKQALAITIAFALAACGGGGDSSPPPTSGGGGGGTSTPPPTTSACDVSNQISFADDVLDQWYLFPNLLDNTVNPASFTTVQSFLDARVAPARAQQRDVGFTFATSIAEETALINSGASAGFGIRLAFDTTNNRVFLLESFENGAGFQVGMDRGTELTSIGTNSGNLQTVSSLMASGGPNAVFEALGPGDPGVTRTIRFVPLGGAATEATITKTEFSLDPISDRYGAQIINDNGRNIGYLNLRTFIVSDAADQLRDAFQLFKDNNVTELVFDFRYNGGGLVSVAETMGDLMGEGRIGDVFSRTVLRPERSDNNETELFETELNALQPEAIALIGTSSTASASELVINAMLPYVAADRIALVGSNTSGKPVGQFAFDLDDCDLRVRAVTFQTVNANDEGEYFTGLASVMPNTCRATDDIFAAFGDPSEDSLATAISFLNGNTCTPIAGTNAQSAQSVGGREIVMPGAPSAAQYQIPGLF